jgi:hypothetical protein
MTPKLPDSFRDFLDATIERLAAAFAAEPTESNHREDGDDRPPHRDEPLPWGWSIYGHW